MWVIQQPNPSLYNPTHSQKGANVDHDRWGHSTTLSSLENVRLPRKVVVADVDDNHGKRGLEFDWHQVSRKSCVVGWGSGKIHGHDQRMDFAFEETSLNNS
jgi:hypothetical protein